MRLTIGRSNVTSIRKSQYQSRNSSVCQGVGSKTSTSPSRSADFLYSVGEMKQRRTLGRNPIPVSIELAIPSNTRSARY